MNYLTTLSIDQFIQDVYETNDSTLRPHYVDRNNEKFLYEHGTFDTSVLGYGL